MLKVLMLISRCSNARSAYSTFYLTSSFRLIILKCLALTGIVWGLAQRILALSSEEEEEDKQEICLGLTPRIVLLLLLLLLQHQLPLPLQLPALLLPLAFPPLPLAHLLLPLALPNLPLAHFPVPMAQKHLPLPLARRKRRAVREVHPCSLVALIQAGIRVS